MAKRVIYIISLVLIILNLISFIGVMLGAISFMNMKEPIKESIALLNIHPRIPNLLYWGPIGGLIITPVYIVAGINLMKLRYWARKLLLWFIPVMLVLDLIYLFLVDMLNISTTFSLVVDFVIWIILLNKTIERQFKKS